MTEAQWEKKLNISTTAATFEKDDHHHSRYEPTSYAVLERLASGGFIRPDDILVDYGCGKGRVGFYLNYAIGCRTVGVEYNPELVQKALQNLSSYSGRSRSGVDFQCCSAEQYTVTNETCFYFFNPFSATILKAVINRIFDSYYENPRNIRLFFYYTQDEYLAVLMMDDRLTLKSEIDCSDLFEGSNPMEKILIFEIE